MKGSLLIGSRRYHLYAIRSDCRSGGNLRSARARNILPSEKCYEKKLMKSNN
jgi:hypothetical protein